MDSATETCSLFSNQLSTASWAPTVSLPHAYQVAGGFGRVQVWAIILAVLSSAAPYLYLSNLVFFEVKPSLYFCSFKANPSIELPCTNRDVCENPNILAFRPNYASSLHNLVVDLNLHCTSRWEIGLIGSSFFLGEAIGSLVFTVFADCFKGSRIKILFGKNIMMTVAISALYLMQSV